MTTQAVALERQAREDALRERDRFRVHHARSSGRKWLLLVLLVGPGVLTMLSENDGPSMLSYLTTGSLYGLRFFAPLVLLTFVMAYVVQEATIRIGIATRRGHAELIFQRFGRGWGYFALADLAFGNVLTLVAEFVAICSGARFLGVPPPISVVCACAFVIAAFAARRYFTWERFAMALAAFNLVFIPIAFAAEPHAQALANVFALSPGSDRLIDPTFVTLILANVGATVTPWMIFFQQSAVVDKGLARSDLWHARFDTGAGAILAAIVAVAGIVVGSALLTHRASTLQTSADFAAALMPVLGKHIATLFALGMIEAGITAAVTISASTAYAAGEVAGSGKSLNRGVREAVCFYGVMCASLLIAAAVVLWPHAPLLMIALLANVAATALMAPALAFVILLANDRAIMGSLANGRLANVAAGTVMLAVSVLGLAYTAMVLFPKLLSG